MKKYLGIFILLVCFLLVGCKDKEEPKNDEPKEEEKTNTVLDCSKSTDDPLYFVTDMIFYFENDTITKLSVKYNYDLSGYNEQQRKAFASADMCSTEDLKTKLGMVDCKEELSGTNYIVSGDAEKLLEQSKGTSSQLKTAYEAQGWTCTIN